MREREREREIGEKVTFKQYEMAAGRLPITLSEERIRKGLWYLFKILLNLLNFLPQEVPPL